jgi:xanthine dehydrogenase YagT iron-sulfur-binding subunit
LLVSPYTGEKDEAFTKHKSKLTAYGNFSQKLMTSDQNQSKGKSRRKFLGQVLTAAGTTILAPKIVKSNTESQEQPSTQTHQTLIQGETTVKLKINGNSHHVVIEPRTALVDVLREQLALTGTKKGCDHGQCGACTVLIDGERVYSCLSLAIMQEGKNIVTIEGLGQSEQLHPVQSAFIDHDGFQCGYCTPGQICASVALLEEVKQGQVSVITPDLQKPPTIESLSETEIKERLSGNLCRCSAYNGIIAAVQQACGQNPPSAAGKMMIEEV